MGREDHRSVEARIPNLAGFSGTTPAQKKEPALQAPLKLGWLKVRLPSSYSLPFLGVLRLSSSRSLSCPARQIPC